WRARPRWARSRWTLPWPPLRPDTAMAAGADEPSGVAGGGLPATTGRRRIVIMLVSAAVGLAAPVAIIALSGGRDQAERSATWTQTYVLAAVLAVPPVLALLSLRRRPALLPAAAAAGFAVGFVGLTFAPVLWLPSLGYLYAYSRAPAPPASARRREPVTIAVVLVLAIVAVGPLFVGTETACWRYVEYRSGERASSRLPAAACHQGTFSASGS